MDLQRWETRELRDAAFACLEGCGFCCTFQPEVSNRELALLRARLKPKPIAITVGDDGRRHLGLQNKCGACTLLERKACTAYDLRPAHCRYFPFHLHFAERPEVYVNYTCRGVERRDGGDLAPAFDQSVLSIAKPDALNEHERLAREAYGEFERLAKRAGAWGDVDAALARVVSQGAVVFTRAWIEGAAEAAGEPATAEEMVDDALAPFADPDVTRRPFYLPADLRWLTFMRDGDALGVLAMDDQGDLSPAGRVEAVSGWTDPPRDVAEGLARYLARLAQRRIFAGSVYALVDDSGYEMSVERAALSRVAEVVVDLSLRARILAAMGVPPDRLADEVARFYDSTFLDSPTIGGFL